MQYIIFCYSKVSPLDRGIHCLVHQISCWKGNQHIWIWYHHKNFLQGRYDISHLCKGGLRGDRIYIIEPLSPTSVFQDRPSIPSYWNVEGQLGIYIIRHLYHRPCSRGKQRNQVFQLHSEYLMGMLNISHCWREVFIEGSFRKLIFWNSIFVFQHIQYIIICYSEVNQLDIYTYWEWHWKPYWMGNKHIWSE